MKELDYQETQAALSLRKSIDQGDIPIFKNSVLKALSDSTRQGIIVILGKYQTLCVNDLAAWFNVSRPTVSHHLNILKEAKMVHSKKFGKETYYYLNISYMKRSVKNLSNIINSLGN